MWQTLITVTVAVLLLAVLYRNFLTASRQRQALPEQVLGNLRSIIADAEISHGETSGVYKVTGKYRGADVAIKAVTDLLMLRKLPSLWLMVTLPGEVKVPAVLDVMLRPAGQSSFSNFDTLPLTFPTPGVFPEQAVLRGDGEEAQRLIPILAGQQQLLSLPRLKEILITPKGLRVVTLLAEASRARYGVYRQADFQNACALADDVRRQLDLLIELKDRLA